MNKMKIFPKMFLQIFSILLIIVILVHVLVFLIFPNTYLENRKQEIQHKADVIALNLNRKSLNYVKETLDFYSKHSETKVSLKGEQKRNSIQIEQDIDINPESKHNSLIIEERNIVLNNGQLRTVQFISTADMQQDAIDLSFKFLPHSLLISLIFSILVAIVYARLLKNNIEEIKNVTDDMMMLDKTALLKVTSQDEVGELKAQINTLYTKLLETIEDLEGKNKEIIKLEQLKYNFFRGISHELKTPLASLKIILENMQHNIGKYKDRDVYIARCIAITDDLSHTISQVLSVSAIDNLKQNESHISLNKVVTEVLMKYDLLIQQKHLKINNNLVHEQIYIGMTALQIIISNLISNAVKYTDIESKINIGVEAGWFYIENTCNEKESLHTDNIFEIKFDLNKTSSNGLGLYIVSKLLDNYNKQYLFETNDNSVKFKIKI